MRWPEGPVAVTVPATSANLGPGFDSLGLALARRDVVEARVLPAGLAIEVSGPGQQLAGAGEDHLVIRAMRAGFAATGGQPPGIGLRCRNSIPQGYGLGSSAAAIIAGLLAARALARQAGPAGLPDDAVLALAAALEGHPDNAAACLAGGLTISWLSAAGPRFARLQPAASVCPVICLPADPMATVAARQALPAAVRHADAAANSARAALLVAALTADPALLMDATEDFLHQAYRAAAMPRTARLIAGLRAAGIPAVISGAGPAVLALTTAGGSRGPADVAAAAAAGPDGGWQVLPLAVDRRGATAISAER
ncbi:MAG TPA: homoserine kinase [Streptosporangiaceae bacterium]|nr:homoserine kinase [Streptosporangiaceae bacterium]